MSKRAIQFIIIICISFLMSGCTAEYNLYINEKEIKEETTIENTEVTLEPMDLLTEITNDYGAYYTIEYLGDYGDCTDNCDKMPFGVMGYKNYNSYLKYNNSKLVSEYFGNIDFTEDSGVYTLIASPSSQLEVLLNDLKYVKSPLNELKINIHIPYKIIENNADSVDNSTYTWLYNKENSSKELKIVFTTKDSLENTTNNDLDNNNNTNTKKNGIELNLVFWIVIVGIVAIIGITIVNKMKKNDSV